MDSEGILLPPKPTFQPPTALFKSTLLDLTPEKKASKSTTNRLKQNGPNSASLTVSTENKSEESKEIYAW